MLKKYSYILKNLDCAVCANKIENKLNEIDNLKDVKVNFNTLKLTFETNIQKNIKKEVSEIVKTVEPEVELIDINKIIIDNKKTKLSLLRLSFGLLFTILGSYLKFAGIISTIFIIFAYVILLSRTIKKAYKVLKMSHSIDENFLITISCVGAYLVGEHMEGLMVIILYEIGKILEDKAINKTRNSINELMNIKPEYANLLKEQEIIVNPEDVEIGSIIIVKKGEKIPLDGIVIEGEGMLDTSSLTGESMPVKVNTNSKVLSGSINLGNILKIKTTDTYENSTVNKILDLVENATDKKAKTETIANSFAKIYTPIVIIFATLVAILLPLFTSLTYSDSFYKALTFLVISCPCAIAISIPLSYFSGIGRASKSGILIKGSNYLDGLKDIKQMVFDKTGTITTGNFDVDSINVINFNYTKEDIQNYIIAGEKLSNHPIAASILNALEQTKEIRKMKNFKESEGYGISYEIDNQKIKIGNDKFVNTIPKEDEYGTIIYLKIDNDIIGYIILKDQIKPKTKNIIRKLHDIGISTKMFTGDNYKIANMVAKESGIDEIEANLLPNEKYKKLQELLDRRSKNEKIAFVGDGINDSPVLTLADVGISMGGVGSAAAIEASDVVIMTDELQKIIESINISKYTSHIIKQNLVFAFGTKLLILLLSIVGISNMWQAIFADVGVTLITILNTLRILKKKNLNK